MASVFTLKSHSYDGRYMRLDCTQTRDVATNTSTISWTLTVTGGDNNYYTTGPTTVKINGVQVYYKAKTAYSTHEFPAAKGSKSGTLIVQHDVNGNATVDVSIKTNIYTGVLKTSSGTWTLDSNPRFATLISAPNFTDEDHPTITYANPAGTNVTSLQACITLDGSDPNVDASVAVAYRDIPMTGTSYTFNDITSAELYSMQYVTTGSNNRKVWIKIKTVIGNTVGYSQLESTFTIANPDPTINPSIVDINPKTIELTGYNKRFIRYYSNASITIGAAPVKCATLESKRVTCGTATLTDDGIIYGITDKNFVFTVTDNRNNVATLTHNVGRIAANFVNYSKPSCKIISTMPDGSGEMNLTVVGSCFTGSFSNTTQNEFHVYYRYKPTGEPFDDSEDPWIEFDNVTYAGSRDTKTYVASTTLSLDYQKAYVFQARAKDTLLEKFEEWVPATDVTVKATPVFDWGENDFKFNVPVYDEFNTAIRNGKAAYTGSAENAIDPNTTVEELILTDHANSPRSGYWFFIRTMLHCESGDDLTTTAYRSQIAIPAGPNMSMYHRTYSSGKWLAWRRLLNEDENFAQVKLLWTNAVPTSPFGVQTISIDLSGYDLVLIESEMDSTFCKVGKSGTMFSHNSYYPCRRTFITMSTGIKFYEGSKYTTCPGNTVATDGDSYCIPRYIYGIKGVS